MSSNYATQGKMKEAYETFLQYDAAREKIYGEESTRRIAQMDVALDLKEKEKALKAKRYECYFYAHFNLGRIYEKHGEVIRALNCYKAAYDENHNYTQALKAFRRLQTRLS